MYQKLAIESIYNQFEGESTLSINLNNKKRDGYIIRLWYNGFTAYDSKLIYLLSSVISFCLVL